MMYNTCVTCLGLTSLCVVVHNMMYNTCVTCFGLTSLCVVVHNMMYNTCVTCFGLTSLCVVVHNMMYNTCVTCLGLTVFLSFYRQADLYMLSSRVVTATVNVILNISFTSLMRWDRH